MSTEQDQARLMATRIARRVSQSGSGMAVQADNAGDVGEELAAVRATLSDLQDKLARIESHITQHEGQPVREAPAARRGEQSSGPHRERASAAASTAHVARSPWLSGMYVPATHPSEERFGVEEAAVSELVDFFEKEKTCSMEPGGKPCDHCSMCSTRGF